MPSPMRERLVLIISLLFLISFFSAFSPYFISQDSLSIVLTRTNELAIPAIGITLLMIAGEFDLSIGAIFSLSAMMCAFILEKTQWPLLAIVISLSGACLVGFINGRLTTHLKLPSFIVTLAMLFILKGINLLVTNGIPISLSTHERITAIIYPESSYAFLPGSLFLMLLLLLAHFILFHSAYGHRIMTAGLNQKLAHRLNLKPTKTKQQLFIFSSFLAGLAGVLQLFHMQTFTHDFGHQLELNAIAAAVIGGSALKGGQGSIVGTLLGTLLLNTMLSGLIQIGASTYWYGALLGLMLIITLSSNHVINQWLNHR